MKRVNDTNELCFPCYDTDLNTHVRCVERADTMGYLYSHEERVTFALNMQILQVNGMNPARLRCNHNQNEKTS
jgi:hypothetical protein